MTSDAKDWLGRARAADFNVHHFIDGRGRIDSGGRLIVKYGPRDGRSLYEFRSAPGSTVDEAVASARRAVEDGRWSDLRAERRHDILISLSALIESRRDELALIDCLDVGKPISEALNGDIPAAAAAVRFAAESVEKLSTKVYSTDPSNLSYDIRRPVGVIAGVTGWNFPLLLAAQKIGPALAAGNSIVLKPSELTPHSATRLAELAREAGVPEGVFNVVHGDGAVGGALAAHHDVDLLTFTGSTRTGKAVMIAAGQSNLKRLVLECGGKSPNIVFEDCPEISAVASSIVASAFLNQGQVCVAGSRLLVQESIKAQLLQAMMGIVAELSPGDPLDEDSRFGALVSRTHMQRVLSYIERGVSEGAKLIHRARDVEPCAGGFYVGPAIFDDVDPKSSIAQDEIFGPVLSVTTFRDEEEALRIANGTAYGLSAALWTSQLGRAHRMTQKLKAGWITVKATAEATGGPSDTVISVGGHGESGIGSEGGVEGIEMLTRKSAVQWYV